MIESKSSLYVYSYKRTYKCLQNSKLGCKNSKKILINRLKALKDL